MATGETEPSRHRALNIDAIAEVEKSSNYIYVYTHCKRRSIHARRGKGARSLRLMQYTLADADCSGGTKCARLGTVRECNVN